MDKLRKLYPAWAAVTVLARNLETFRRIVGERVASVIEQFQEDLKHNRYTDIHQQYVVNSESGGIMVSGEVVFHNGVWCLRCMRMYVTNHDYFYVSDLC